MFCDNWSSACPQIFTFTGKSGIKLSLVEDMTYVVVAVGKQKGVPSMNDDSSLCKTTVFSRALKTLITWLRKVRSEENIPRSKGGATHTANKPLWSEEPPDLGRVNESTLGMSPMGQTSETPGKFEAQCNLSDTAHFPAYWTQEEGRLVMSEKEHYSHGCDDVSPNTDVSRSPIEQIKDEHDEQYDSFGQEMHTLENTAREACFKEDLSVKQEMCDDEHAVFFEGSNDGHRTIILGSELGTGPIPSTDTKHNESVPFGEQSVTHSDDGASNDDEGDIHVHIGGYSYRSGSDTNDDDDDDDDDDQSKSCAVSDSEDTQLRSKYGENKYEDSCVRYKSVAGSDYVTWSDSENHDNNDQTAKALPKKRKRKAKELDPDFDPEELLSEEASNTPVIAKDEKTIRKKSFKKKKSLDRDKDVGTSSTPSVNLESFDKNNIFHTEQSLCDWCGRVFKSRTALRGHKKICPKSRKKYKCSWCEYTSPSRQLVRIHEDTHTNKKLPCETCNKVFSSERNLRQHTNRRHRTEWRDKIKAQCEDCGKILSSPWNLMIHRRQHMDVKPLKCSLCDYACRQKNALNWHMKSKHKDSKE